MQSLNCQICCLLVLLFSFSLIAEADKKLATEQTANKEMRKMKIIEHKSGKWSPDLSTEEQETLFAIAKNTLEWCVVNKQRDKFDFGKYNITDKLKTKYATFVTLKIKGQLRGCIGTLAPEEELYLSVHHNAIHAALEDFRFPPVRAAEVPNISISVSILSPVQPIKGWQDFKIGEHGIIIAKKGRRAVFLPEVAIEQNWDAPTTLTHLAMKAGLNPDDWKEGASFAVFESVVLSGEEE